MFKVVTRSIVCTIFAVETHVGGAISDAAMGTAARQVGYHVHDTRRHEVEETVSEKQKVKVNDRFLVL